MYVRYEDRYIIGTSCDPQTLQPQLMHTDNSVNYNQVLLNSGAYATILQTGVMVVGRVSVSVSTPHHTSTLQACLT